MKRRISCLKHPDGFVDITVPPAMYDEFRVMVQRASNTWQDMSPDMRDFVDRVLDRDKVMGENMKEGFEKEYVVSNTWNIPPVPPTLLAAVETAKAALATRSCCGTLLCEPHLTVCPHISGIPATPRT